MALPYLRDKRHGSQNRLYFFMRELYSVEHENNLKTYNASDEEHRKQIYRHDAPPEEQWSEIYDALSQYHLYLEREYGGATGSVYSLKISNHPLKPRGVFSCEYVKDFGSMTDFLDAYYGFNQNPASKINIWKKYHRFAKVEHYSPAELAEKLVQLSRELLYRYHTQEYLDDQDCFIQCYSIDFEWNHINVWLHCKNRKNDYEYLTCAYLKAV